MLPFHGPGDGHVTTSYTREGNEHHRTVHQCLAAKGSAYGNAAHQDNSSMSACPMSPRKLHHSISLAAAYYELAAIANPASIRFANIKKTPSNAYEPAK